MRKSKPEKGKPKQRINERKQSVDNCIALASAYTKDERDKFGRTGHISHYFRMTAGKDIIRLLKALKKIAADGKREET